MKKPTFVNTTYIQNEDTETYKTWLKIQDLRSERDAIMLEYKKKIDELEKAVKDLRRKCNHEFHVSYVNGWCTCYSCIHCHKLHYLYT